MRKRSGGSGGLGIKDMAPDKVCCMDASAIGWRLLRRKTFAPKGGQQKKIKTGNPTYTNLVVWCNFPDGVNRCPALLFSGDPQFNSASYASKRLPELCEKYIIDQSRIIYCKGLTSVAETPAVVKSFLDYYPFLRECLILTDSGRSYRKKNVDIIADWGARHESLKSATHEYLSTLDNHAFGIAKGVIRANDVDQSDRLVPSLLFMDTLDKMSRETVASMWRRNFLLDQRRVSKEAVRAVLEPQGKNEKERSDFYDKCRDSYRVKVLNCDPLYPDDLGKELQSDLDGAY